MIHFHFNVNADLSALESQMAELNDQVNDIKASLAAEAEQGAALKAKVDDLQAKLDTLLTDTYAKAEVNAALDEIKALIPGIVPDAPPAE